jgi:hypothetical protein
MSARRELAAFVCSHVFQDTRPILLASRADGDWQFLCGDVHEGDTPRVVGVEHIFGRDPTVAALRDLPVDWEAERATADSPWIRRKVGQEG